MTARKVESIDKIPKGSEPWSPTRAFARPPIVAVSQSGFHAATAPQIAGNQAVQQLFRAGAIQAKLSISQSGDADEQEADRFAEQIVQRKAAPCSCGGLCSKCQARAEPTLHRKRDDSSSVMDGTESFPSSGGRTLDAATRAHMEGHFGHDFSGVRVHTGGQADRSAQLLNARAYTFGQDIVFREGTYQPQTDAGKRLLAHELTHVVQQQGAPTIRRKLHGDPRQFCITPAWAKALTDTELIEQDNLLKNYLLAQTHLLAGTPDYVSAQQNMAVLEEEQRARVLRQAGFGVPSGAPVPRPPGLPLEEGYTLQLLADLPPEIAAHIPEGQVVTLSPGAPLGSGVRQPDQPWMEGLGGGSVVGLSGANAALMNYGFAPAGDFAIGLVAIPPANVNPFSPNFNPIDLAAPLERAGHTAVYVRQGGKIIIVRGYNPQMSTPSSFLNVARNQGNIFSGKTAVPGEITADASLFKSTAARTIEFPVTPEVAAQLVSDLPALGPPGPGQPPFYTAPPSEYGRITGTQPGCVGTNCGLWATQKAEAAMGGGRIGVAGEPPIVDVPVPGQASQGKLYGMMGRVREGAPTAEMPGASGPALAGEMSTGLKLLKWGGRVFIVGSLAKLSYDVLTAPPGEGLHVAVVGGGGFVGGFVGGAALGLVCGPGAPVCSVITGIIGGVFGALGGATLAEGLWQLGTELGQTIQWMGGHENPTDTEYYEREDRKKWDKMFGDLTDDEY